MLALRHHPCDWLSLHGCASNVQPKVRALDIGKHGPSSLRVGCRDKKDAKAASATDDELTPEMAALLEGVIEDDAIKVSNLRCCS